MPLPDPLPPSTSPKLPDEEMDYIQNLVTMLVIISAGHYYDKDIQTDFSTKSMEHACDYFQSKVKGLLQKRPGFVFVDVEKNMSMFLVADDVRKELEDYSDPDAPIIGDLPAVSAAKCLQEKVIADFPIYVTFK
jgi:hypothetical protein